ncbi:transcriptional regulator with XRE-family HTH domain [Spinactinospora alkalitolerans]|uniref:Transcriptional regulator with XRE-family HTH domain n=1 Tax=Spinactinospora alkalitolerans TaxID=687207 RepID=A0A852U4H1_9ACTN|nr:helix-turn-helix transcriptional regulator [Spinactinospora alkalitolerans]NYE48850.1 transcriptional regulator with XRE-family HTH domain [Spinactinospora alkalitolerans]
MAAQESFERERAELAEEIRRLRVDSGMSGVAAAERLGWSQSKVSKIETGRVTPGPDDVDAMLTVFAASPSTRRRIAARAAELNERYGSLRMLRKRGLHRVQDAIAHDERATALTRAFQPTMVPGLLQTAEYARAVFSQPLSMAGVDVAEAVQSRLNRQSVLFDTERRFHFVLTEAALRWKLGDARMMAAQMDRISNLSTLTNVRVGVLSWERSVPQVPKSAFVIRDEREVAVEGFTTHQSITDPRDIAFHLQLFELFADSAVYDGEARDFLARLAREHA